MIDRRGGGVAVAVDTRGRTALGGKAEVDGRGWVEEDVAGDARAVGALVLLDPAAAAAGAMVL